MLKEPAGVTAVNCGSDNATEVTFHCAVPTFCTERVASLTWPRDTSMRGVPAGAATPDPWAGTASTDRVGSLLRSVTLPVYEATAAGANEMFAMTCLDGSTLNGVAGETHPKFALSLDAVLRLRISVLVSLTTMLSRAVSPSVTLPKSRPGGVTAMAGPTGGAPVPVADIFMLTAGVVGS